MMLSASPPHATDPSDPIGVVASALSDATRRSILRLVRDEERSAGEIAAGFPEMSRPAVSQHLRVLRDAGLLSVRSEGKFRLFQARAEGMADMWNFIDEMWTDRLARLKLVAERAEWPERQRASLAKASGRSAPLDGSTPVNPDEGVSR
jgi:DNA-binding transcriptional ArsR family regulator